MRHRQSIRSSALVFTFLLSAASLRAQQEVGVDIFRNQAAGSVKIAIPFPTLAAGVTPDAIHDSFFSPLTRDLAFSEIFTIVPLPPATSPSMEQAGRSGAQALLRLDVTRDGDELVVEARLYDIASKSIQLGKRYRGTPPAMTRMAHMIASDLVRYFNGKPGVFLTQIAYVSTLTGHKEIWLMDYDGSNRHRITSDNSIALNPDWSADAEQLAYTSFGRGTSSDIYIINRRGGGRIRLATGLGLNTAVHFSPDGKELAFVGSIAGNPDIYVMHSDGSGIRRVTTSTSIESTPSWSPTGREIAFVSGRSGSPQIYVMDAEGSNVRRISFEGDWNDDPVYSCSGDLLAYTSRVEGRFQIRIMNLVTGESRVLAGEGSNEQPAWSPDGRSILFASNRTGHWQIYRIGLDGRNLMQLTGEGDNTAPRWSAISQ
jgi:TolB protein